MKKENEAIVVLVCLIGGFLIAIYAVCGALF